MDTYQYSILSLEDYTIFMCKMDSLEILSKNIYALKLTEYYTWDIIYGAYTYHRFIKQ